MIGRRHRLVLFARFPVAGRVKTRLIPALGAEGAAALHRRLVLRSLRTAEAACRETGAEYGVQPMTFAVHSEYINRPSVVIVDKEGIIRFAYYGTFWGDRPSIRRILELVRSGDYRFEAPKRLQPQVAP